MIITKHNTLEELQDICYKSLLSILTDMGLKDGISSETNQIKTILNVIDKYERFLEECIRSLTEYNYIQPNESTLTIPKDIQDELINFNWQEKLKEIILETPKLKNHSKLLEECLKGLKDILQGDLRATDILFPDGSMELVSGVYSENEEADYFNDILCQVVESIVSESVKNLEVGEKFTILEIGAGTGGTSNLLFETLKPYKDQISYMYTDISKSFLLHAEKNFKTIAPYLDTAIFNIEKSPELQKIPLGNFDMVIGANVVHATKNIQKSLKNIKETLKINGVLILNEIAQNHISSTLTFGLLDGWWLYEDVEVRMKGSPGLALEGWQKVLTDTGFTNTIKYPEDEELSQQIIISQSDGEIIRIDDGIKKLDDTKEKETNTPEKTFKTRIEDTVISGEINITEIKNFIKTKLAFVLKMELSELDEDTPMLDYGVDSILGLELIKEINEGLSDTIPTTILFDYPTIKELANYLAEEYTSDFIVQKGEVESKIPQQPETVKNEVVSTSIDNEKGQAKRLWIEKPSTIDDIKLVNFDLPEVKQDEVLVENSHFSLNFGDLLCVKGLYPTMPPYPFSPGFEASGTIIKKGNAVNNFKLGDKVIVMADGNYGLHSTHCIANESQLLPIPKNQSFEEACAIPIVAITMIESFRRIRVKKGDYILIQTATGGIGQMAVQLSKHFKLNIIATAGSTHKVEYLKQTGLPFAINYRELDFEEEVNKITNGKGVKVVINTLSGENIQKGINCLGKGGQYVELSMTALKSANQIDLSKLSNNQTFIAVNLREFIDEDRAYLEELWNECKEYIEKGILKPVISTEIPLENYKEAYKILEDRENIGKVIVKANSTKIPHIEEIVNNNFRVTELFNEVSSKTLDIAVVGMSGQYGNTKDLNDFWEKLESGKSLIEEIPKDRWDINEHFSTDEKAFNKTYSKWGSFLRDIDKFDPLFFRISGKEAEGMDPQQRFFLQHCWKALEDAAIVPDQLNGKKCGVYVGASQGDYVQTNNFENASVYWGNSSAILASRIAYLINLQGPAIAIDTACSSSLVALDMACKSLYHKEIDMAISGGVFIGTTPRFYKLSSMANMLSKDGKCYTFDERANGFVPGEGVGVLILKRLEDAKRDGDFIHAVIKGTGSNQDGTTNGILAPSMKSQARLESEVYEEYDIHPETITYVEAHGTGTKLGDPIEFEGLTRAFKKKTDKTNYCGLGSVKTNIGHTVYAAGVAGVQKVILAIKNKKIPPTLNYKNKNNLIDIKNSPFYIANKLSKWETTNSEPRRAAVSSFGFSGTNAHVVIEEYKDNHKDSYFNKECIVPISAKSNEALNLQKEQLADYLEQNPEIAIADVAYTLQVGRQSMEYRMAYIVSSTKGLLTKLRDQKSFAIDHSIATNGKEQFKTFLSNRSGEVYIKHAIENNELKSLVDLWIIGVEIDWNKLYKDDLQKPKRISLPTYPFEKNRFWLDAGKINLSIENNQRASNECQEDIDKIEESENRTVKELLFNKVHTLVADLLGISKSKIDIKKELSMYGITSISLAELNSKLDTYYGISLLPSTFYNYKTIESLVEYLLEEHSSAVIKKHKKKDEEIRLKEDILPVPKVAELSLSQIDTMYPQNTIEDSNYLIQYHELMKDKPNIFIIPGVPGVAYGYYELAEQFYQYGNCFGITMQGIFDGKKPLNSIEKMAAHNIEEITKVIQPNTEISLVAHSFGGLLTYEMVKQLKESSIKVRQIFMLDCFTNTLSVGDLEKMVLFLRLFPEIADEIEPDTLNKEIQQILQEKTKPKEKLLYDFITKNGVMIDQKTFINLWNVLDVSMNCTYEMDIQYDVPVTLAKVKDQVVSNELKDFGWGKYFKHVKVVHAEGDHFSIIRKPNCSELMKEITFEESQLIK